MKVSAISLFILSFLFHPRLVESKLGAPHEDLLNVTIEHQNLPIAVVVAKERRHLVNLVGHGADPWFKLGVCEGDCDNDEECESGLKCYQRDANDPVPGCYGGEKFGVGTDFCIKTGGGPNPSPTPPPANGGGMGLCQSDCDRDSDCKGNLICHQRGRGDLVPPQCPGQSTKSQKDYCILLKPSGGNPSPTQPSPTQPKPTPPPPTQPKPTQPAPTNPSPTRPAPTNPSPTPATVYTGRGFDLCGGDCDRDSDCKNGLICYQRKRGDSIPSGCRGNQNSQKDFCVPSNHLDGDGDQDNDNGVAADRGTAPAPPSSGPGSSPSTTSGKFQLKIYWEEGYMWQDESKERKWCVMRDYKGYPGTGKCWYGLDVLPCNPSHVYTAKCDNDKRQQWVFAYVNDSEVQIKVPGENRCLMRQGIEIQLVPCDSASPMQRFFAIRGGFEEYRFEISMKTATRFCFNQAHHPKPGEVMAMYPCARTRSADHMTSWLNKYYGN